MKIGVLEWDITSLGGRQRTMLTFADYFAEMGHDVFVFTRGTPNVPGSPSPYECPRVMGLHTLSQDDILTIDYSAGGDDRLIVKSKAIELFDGLDLLLVGYGGYGYLQEHVPHTRVVAWVINPIQVRPKSLKEFWTNCQTTWIKLMQSKWGCGGGLKSRILVPPHDYAPIRHASKEPSAREYDFLYVSGAVPSKRYDLFMNTVKGLREDSWVGKAAMAISTWGIDIEQSWLDTAERCATEAGIDLMFNPSRDDIERLYGNSKVFCLPSTIESCPLVIYEAMSGGCHIASRDVGAVREQTGENLHIFNTDGAMKHAMLDALECSDARCEYRGAPQFDRRATRVKSLIKMALEDTRR